VKWELKFLNILSMNCKLQKIWFSYRWYSRNSFCLRILFCTETGDGHRGAPSGR